MHVLERLMAVSYIKASQNTSFHDLSWSRTLWKGLVIWISQKTTTTPKGTPTIQGKSQVPPALDEPSTPREVIEQTQDILQSIISCSLVATALSRSGKMVREKAGHLPSQPWVHSLRGATFRGKERKREKARWQLKEAMMSLKVW